MSQVRITLTRIRIQLLTLNRVPPPDPDPSFNFDADPEPDPTFHFDADRDPAPQHIDTNLQPLAYRSSRAPGWDSVPPLWAVTATGWASMGLFSASIAPEFGLWYGSASGFFTLLRTRIPIRLLKMMRIYADLDPHHGFRVILQPPLQRTVDLPFTQPFLFTNVFPVF